uniref:Putative ovule protein n=1 Tax=Solanum chacoense TaxID=4108 RepID=A0A0V0H9Y4_SOLCH
MPPLHVTCSTSHEHLFKPFRFLNFWTKHHNFLQTVEEIWQIEATGSLFTVLQTKLKRVKSALVQWSKTTFGNIFQQVATLEDLVKTKEIQLEINPSGENRNALKMAEAKLKRYLHIEEEYWKQKACMK